MSFYWWGTQGMEREVAKKKVKGGERSGVWCAQEHSPLLLLKSLVRGSHPSCKRGRARERVLNEAPLQPVLFCLECSSYKKTNELELLRKKYLFLAIPFTELEKNWRQFSNGAISNSAFVHFYPLSYSKSRDLRVKTQESILKKHESHVRSASKYDYN